MLKTSNITQDTLLTNVMHYLSNEDTVTYITLSNFITTSNEVTNPVTNPFSNAYSHNEVMKQLIDQFLSLESVEDLEIFRGGFRLRKF